MDPEIELARLHKRVERERRARQEAEAHAEDGMRQLYSRGRELELLYVVTDAASRAATTDEALQVAIDQLCTYTAWPVGHVYRVNEEAAITLVSTKLWHIHDEQQFASFRAASENVRFKPGEGLPGRVYEKREPVWLSNVTKDDNFPRDQAAIAVGLRGAIGIPVFVGERVVAILEFFSRETTRPDERWLEVMRQIGTQVGRNFEREARHDAEAANRAKSEFLSRMSHELRTPLNAILGFSQLLQSSSLPEDEKESVDYIHRAGLHLLELINEVLDISRIEAGRLDLDLESVLVRDALRETLDLMQPLAAEHRIGLQLCATDNFDVCVRADPKRLRQVLLNLVTNAVKYNRPQGRVTLCCQPSADDHLRLAIVDTGNGISPEKAKRLFVPFDRLGAEQTEVQGTGLGLALSKSLTEAMGGELGFKSEVGRGTTFWIDLPRALLETSLKPASDSLPEESKLPSTTILYIEDNISNLTLVERLLKKHPEVRLLSAGEGQSGFELARRRRPDLIFLDIHLPDVNGDEILRRLRIDPETAAIPVIMLSADATADQIERLRSAGASDYLTKPLDFARFFAAIREHCGDASKISV